MNHPSLPLGWRHISQAIQATFSALSQHNLEACLFGSCAGMLHGMEHRLPKDVDVLILNAPADGGPEYIKQLLASTDSNFSLVKSRVSGATHHVLWYALPDDSRPTPSARANKKKEAPSLKPEESSKSQRACKVDILFPGTLGIPLVPRSHLHSDPSHNFVAYFPSAMEPKPQICPVTSLPFSTLLMTKLRAWADHTQPSATEIMHEHIPGDEEDLEELLRISLSLGPQGVVRPTSGSGRDADLGGDLWMLGGFSDWTEARRWVREYMKKWPRTTIRWRDVGLA